MSSKNRSSLYMVYEVSKWEFKRWFKLKEQIITFVVMALISVLIFGSKSLIGRFSDKNVKVAVINTPALPIEVNRESNIILLEKKEIEFQEQLNSLSRREIDGILLIKDIDNSELIVNKEPGWLKYVQDALSLSRRQVKLKQSEISPEKMNDIFKPAVIKLNLTAGPAKEKSTTAEKITAGLMILLMLVGVFFGLAYQFVAITGEKQLRITEVIISAISPQTWIDGKILGISMLSLALLVTFSLSSLVFVLLSAIFGSGWSIPIELTNPLLIITLLLFSICGFFFWNTFFTALAATINDPNTSARGSLIMFPFFSMGAAFFAIGNPDSLAMKILSLFPLTAPPVISVRMVLTSVSIPEIVLSLSLLVLSTWYLRKAAGKIFALSILMYGKEPSWKEISRWIKA
ncbi:MAG: ABC transporter permease [Methanococcaceae archaeon]